MRRIRPISRIRPMTNFFPCLQGPCSPALRVAGAAPKAVVGGFASPGGSQAHGLSAVGAQRGRLIRPIGRIGTPLLALPLGQASRQQTFPVAPFFDEALAKGDRGVINQGGRCSRRTGHRGGSLARRVPSG
jgi:hypothetical protein